MIKCKKIVGLKIHLKSTSSTCWSSGVALLASSLRVKCWLVNQPRWWCTSSSAIIIAVESLRWGPFTARVDQQLSQDCPPLNTLCRGLYPVHTLTAIPSLPIVPTRFRHMSTVQPDSQGTPVSHVWDMCRVGPSSCRWPQPQFSGNWRLSKLSLEDFSLVFSLAVNCWWH